MGKIFQKFKKIFMCGGCEKRVSTVRGYEIQLKDTNTRRQKRSSKDYLKASLNDQITRDR